MNTEITAPHKDFEAIRKNDENGIEYWEARELLPLLGYEKWEKAEEVVGRAAQACMNSGQDVDNHFHQTGKMVQIGSNTMRRVRDYKLDRYACYLIAQNGDPKKREIALAQTYFALQTRRQEVFEQLSDTTKRLFIRNEVSDHNKRLFRTAKNAGVSKFGLFNDAGYQGLYGASFRASPHGKKYKTGQKRSEAIGKDKKEEAEKVIFANREKAAAG